MSDAKIRERVHATCDELRRVHDVPEEALTPIREWVDAPDTPAAEAEGLAKDNGKWFDRAQAAEGRLRRIAEIIERVDHRAASADGPVSPTLHEMRQEEIAEIYDLGKCGRAPAAEAHCEFCEGAMPTGDTSGHGLGECAPICPTCDGSGSAEAPSPVVPEEVRKAADEPIIPMGPAPAEPGEGEQGACRQVGHAWDFEPDGRGDFCSRCGITGAEWNRRQVDKGPQKGTSGTSTAPSPESSRHDDGNEREGKRDDAVEAWYQRIMAAHLQRLKGPATDVPFVNEVGLGIDMLRARDERIAELEQACADHNRQFGQAAEQYEAAEQRCRELREVADDLVTFLMRMQGTPDCMGHLAALKDAIDRAKPDGKESDDGS